MARAPYPIPDRRLAEPPLRADPEMSARPCRSYPRKRRPVPAGRAGDPAATGAGARRNAAWLHAPLGGRESSRAGLSRRHARSSQGNSGRGCGGLAVQDRGSSRCPRRGERIPGRSTLVRTATPAYRLNERRETDVANARKDAQEAVNTSRSCQKTHGAH